MSWTKRSSSFTERFTAAEIATIVDFLELTTEIGGRHRDRLAEEGEEPH